MYIYWIVDGKKRGPVAVSDFISMLEVGDISPDTLCWHSGCSGWLPARELPALAAFFKKDVEEDESESDAPAAPRQAASSAAAAAADPSSQQQALPRLGLCLPRPSDRFMARLVDCHLYVVAVTGLCYFFHVPFSLYLQPGNLLFWLPMILLEALLVKLRLPTPGKAFFGIAFFPPSRIPFIRALVRSLLAIVIGMGCMQPILALFTLPLTLYSLKKRHLTSWDIFTGIIPVQTHPEQRSPLRLVLFVILILLCSQLYSFFLQPWMPDMLRELQSYWPEAADFFLPPQ